MSQKYRLRKDLPDAKAGTILTQDGLRAGLYLYAGFYDEGVADSWYIPSTVENNPDWFEPIEEVKEPERIEVTLFVEQAYNSLGGYVENGYSFTTNNKIEKEKIPTIKEAIEFVLNNEPTDVKIGDYTFKFQSVGFEAKFTQSDIDNARKEAFEAARLIHPIAGMKFDNLEQYLNHIKQNNQ